MKVPLIFFSTCALIERQSALQAVKRANVGPDPRVSAAIQGGLLGAGGGALVQVLRRMLQTKQEQEEEGSPSILKGMLMGGLGGAGLGAGAAHYFGGGMGPQSPLLGEEGTVQGLPAMTPDMDKPNTDPMVIASSLGLPPSRTRSGAPWGGPAAGALTLNSVKNDPMQVALAGINSGALPPGITNPSILTMLGNAATKTRDAAGQAVDKVKDAPAALQQQWQAADTVEDLLRKQRAAGPGTSLRLN